jgi:hypothetical protein
MERGGKGAKNDTTQTPTEVGSWGRNSRMTAAQVVRRREVRESRGDHGSRLSKQRERSWEPCQSLRAFREKREIERETSPCAVIACENKGRDRVAGHAESHHLRPFNDVVVSVVVFRPCPFTFFCL